LSAPSERSTMTAGDQTSVAIEINDWRVGDRQCLLPARQLLIGRCDSARSGKHAATGNTGV
jgi:hypothetical protein